MDLKDLAKKHMDRNNNRGDHKIFPTDRDRAILEFFQSYGMVGVTGSIYTETNIQGTFSQVAFNPLNTQVSGQTISGKEIRLNVPDGFCVTRMGLFFVKAGTTTSATEAQRIVAKPHTFPNDYVFTGTSEAANLFSILNSTLQVTIDRVKFYETLDTLRFLRAGTAQQGLAQSANATVNTFIQSDWGVPEYGMIDLTPTFVLNGLGTNNITLVMPGSVNVGGTSSTNYLGLMMRGFLFPQGAAAIRDNQLVEAFHQKFNR